LHEAHFYFCLFSTKLHHYLFVFCIHDNNNNNNNNDEPPESLEHSLWKNVFNKPANQRPRFTQPIDGQWLQTGNNCFQWWEIFQPSEFLCTKTIGDSWKYYQLNQHWIYSAVTHSFSYILNLNLNCDIFILNTSFSRSRDRY